MWRIGDLNIDGRVVLGPMSGYSSTSYREFMRSFGAAMTVTEMTSDAGIVNNLDKTIDYVRFEHNYPTCLQIFGNKPEVMAKAAGIALKENPNIDLFDINMGCPVPKIVRNGAGSALMKDPKKCGEIIRLVKDAVDIPVTAKIRLGWSMDNITYREVIEEVTKADVDAITVHARTKNERYSGMPHYDMIKDLQSEMSVPLIISGNIYSLKDAICAMNITGATGVMVARGGVGNPFLVKQIDHYLRTGESLPNPTISQQVEWCLELADKLIDEKSNEIGMMKMRSIAPKFITGCRRCREYRKKLATETPDHDHLVSLLNEIESKMGSEQIYTDGHVADIEEEF